MPMSELEARAFETDMQAREVLLRMLGHKREIEEALKNPSLSVLDERRLKSVRDEIVSQINQYRFSGTF